MAAPLDYLGHIATESERFRTVLVGADRGAAVPTCPDWSAGDLLWHLTEVQSFWGRVVEQRCTTPEELTGDDPVRPAAHPALVALGERAGRQLVSTLRRTPPDTPVWTWADEQSAGFVRRRQAHEALVHRVDAECTVGDRTPLDPALATDGVDEALRIMFGGAPGWAEVTVEEQATVRLRTTDTGVTWLATLARFDGTDPDGHEHHDVTLVVDADDAGLPAAAGISAAAGDLDCWLWGRPPLGDVQLVGDVAVLAGFRRIVDTGIA